MPVSGGQISALHLAIAAGGGVLMYAAFQDMTPLEALREIVSGQSPAAIAERSSQVGESIGRGAGDLAGSMIGASGGDARLVAAATRYLGVPYVWGGVTPKGMDCSGLIVLAFQGAYGVTPPRTTYGQEVWRRLAKVKRSDLQPGDLVFWPGHVAIYTGAGKVIHAPHPGAVVRYEGINTAGPVGQHPTSYQRYKGATSAGTPQIVSA